MNVCVSLHVQISHARLAALHRARGNTYVCMCVCVSVCVCVQISNARLAALHHARGETMEINGGHSDGDSMAAQMVMRMQGGNWGDNLYSNRTNGYDMYEDMADDGYGYCEDGFDVDAYDWCGEGEDEGEESSSDEDTDEDGSDAEDNSASHGSAGSK